MMFQTMHRRRARAAAISCVISLMLPALAMAQDQGDQASTSAEQHHGQFRKICGDDYQKFCSGTQRGGGRILACLNEHLSQLSSSCHDAVAKVEARKASKKDGDTSQ